MRCVARLASSQVGQRHVPRGLVEATLTRSHGSAGTVVSLAECQDTFPWRTALVGRIPASLTGIQAGRCKRSPSARSAAQRTQQAKSKGSPEVTGTGGSWVHPQKFRRARKCVAVPVPSVGKLGKLYRFFRLCRFGRFLLSSVNAAGGNRQARSRKLILASAVLVASDGYSCSKLVQRNPQPPGRLPA